MEPIYICSTPPEDHNPHVIVFHVWYSIFTSCYTYINVWALFNKILKSCICMPVRLNFQFHIVRTIFDVQSFGLTCAFVQGCLSSFSYNEVTMSMLHLYFSFCKFFRTKLGFLICSGNGWDGDVCVYTSLICNSF